MSTGEITIYYQLPQGLFLQKNLQIKKWAKRPPSPFGESWWYNNVEYQPKITKNTKFNKIENHTKLHIVWH